MSGCHRRRTLPRGRGALNRAASMAARVTRWRRLAVGLAVLMAAVVPSRPLSASTSLLASHAPPLVAAPSYFRPLVVHGKTSPLARSKYVSLTELSDTCTAARLALA